MFDENIGLFIKKDKLFDFIRKASNYGFIKDNDGDYICKKILSNDNKELYLNITVNLYDARIYIEFNIPCAYWLEVGLNTFEPLFILYKQGYFEIKTINHQF